MNLVWSVVQTKGDGLSPIEPHHLLVRRSGYLLGPTRQQESEAARWVTLNELLLLAERTRG